MPKKKRHKKEVLTMKNQTFKRFLSLLMAISLVLSCGILSVAAEDTEEICEHSFENGVCTNCQQVACTFGLDCQATVHADQCLTQASCTCTILCSETMSCPVCEAGGECKGQPDTQPEPIVCDGTDTCAAETHNETCARYDHCEALGCTEEAHHADCPKGQTEPEPDPIVCDGTETCAAEEHDSTCARYDHCAALGCTEDAHHADCPKGPCTKTEGCQLVKNHEGDCTGMTTYPSPVTDPVAKIGDTGYTSLTEALANAVANNIVSLQKDVVLGANGEDPAIDTGEGVTLDLNGKTLKGPMVGTLKMNGGTYYTTDTFKMVAPTASTGADKAAYVSSNAVFLIGTNGITIISGNVSLDQSMGTQEGHTLIVNSGASFTVPQNMLLLLRSGTNVTVSGTLNNQGTIELAAGATLTGEVSGTMKFSGGTYKNSTTNFVAPIGTSAIFNTNDATLQVAGVNPAITVVSGTVTQGNNLTIAAGYTLTVKSGATYTIPSGKQLRIAGSAVVENGAALTCSGSILLTDKNATLTAPANLTVITTIANHKVVYANGIYKVVENAHVLVNNTPYYYGTGTGEYANFEAVFKAMSPAAFTLTQNETFNSNFIMSSASMTTISLNGHTLSGTGYITSGGNLAINEVGKVSAVNGNTHHNLLLGLGDKIAFTGNGAFNVTVAADNSLTYGSFNMTEVYPTNSYTKVCYLETGTVMTFNTNGKYVATDSILLQDPSANGKPTYYMTAVYNNTTLSHSFIYGSTATMTFESNAFHSGFSKVTVTKGTTVKELKVNTDYTSKKGSTIVTLKNSYLKTLAKGDYVVTLYFQDGNSVSANLYVVASAKPATNPQTGDLILISVAVMLAAGAGLGVLIYLGKKKKK